MIYFYVRSEVKMDSICYCGTQHQNKDAFCDECNGNYIIECKDDICCIMPITNYSESDTYYVQNN